MVENRQDLTKLVSYMLLALKMEKEFDPVSRLPEIVLYMLLALKMEKEFDPVSRLPKMVLYMFLALRTGKEFDPVSRLKKKDFLFQMELSDFLVLQISQVVMVFDYNSLVVNSEIIDHVVVAFVVEYH
jgi:hypothetical protein